MKFFIYAIHPIMYQTPIFAALERRVKAEALPIDPLVLFGDDLSLREVFFKETNVTYKPDTPSLMMGYSYKFLRNYSADSRAGFWSRVNVGILGKLWRERPKIILIHGYESMTAWMALAAAKLLGIRVIWRGEAVPRTGQSRLKRMIKVMVLRPFLRSCDAILYSCTGNREYIEDMLGKGARRKRLHSIPCAVDNDYFRRQHQEQSPRRKTQRAELGISDDDFAVIFCARITARKRPKDLIAAIAKTGNPRVVALMVGDGPEKAATEQYAKELGVRCVFSGFKNQSEVAQYYSMADAAAVLSEYDPSPKAMNEAMNFALPIIVTRDVGTAVDLVKQGENGFVVSVGDRDAIARAIDELAQDRGAAARMGAKSQDIVSEWNYERDVDGILAAVAEVQGVSAGKEHAPQ